MLICGTDHRIRHKRRWQDEQDVAIGYLVHERSSLIRRGRRDDKSAIAG